MYKLSTLLSLCCILLLTACKETKTTVNPEDGLASFNADRFKAHVAVLASDSFMGRKPFTAGETKTVDYLQQQFKTIGIEAGNGTSYLQEVPMVNIVATAAPGMSVQSPKG